MDKEYYFKINFLNGYRFAKEQLQRQEIRIKEIRSDYCSDVVDRYKSSLPYINLLAEEEHKYIKARYLKALTCKHIIDRIEGLKDEKEKNVLTYRYIKMMTWKEIRERMFYSRKGIEKLHQRALSHLKID